MITQIKKAYTTLSKKANTVALSGVLLAQAAVHDGTSNNVVVNGTDLQFQIPNLSDVLTFMIRLFFVVAGLLALLYLLLGALEWVTSGGSKDGVEKARNKIQAAIVGVILIAVVLAIIVTLEQVVFGGKICFGLSCGIKLPTLVK